MKKAVVFLITVCLLLLSAGCGSPEKPAEIPKEMEDRLQRYETLAQVEYGDLKATLSAYRDENRCELVFREPEALRGLRAVMNRGKATVSFGSVSLNLTERGMTDDFVGRLLIGILNRKSGETGVTARLEGDGFHLLSKMEGDGRCDLRIDAKTGFLVTLDYPEKNLHVEFYEFRFIEPQEPASAA